MKTSISIVTVLFAGVTFLNSCSDKSRNSYSNDTEYSVESGKQLVQTHCSSCHQVVSPNMLSRDIWTDEVLPAMAPKLGIKVFRKKQYYPALNGESSSAISFSDWMSIVQYFEEEAPEQLKSAKVPVPLKNDWSIFELRKPDARNTSTATTVLVAFDPYQPQVYSSDAGRKTLTVWNRQLEPSFVRHLPAPAVDVNINKDENNHIRGVFTTIGTMRAVNVQTGEIRSMNLDSETDRVGQTIAADLPRPVKSVPGDFNNDGLEDWIVCGFGHDYGGLYLYEQKPDQRFTKKAIRVIPGAVDVEVKDFNRDGWPDMMVLFAHADEGIWMFINDRKGGFASKQVLRFSPVSGSTSFQLVDFNRDGKLDILYTSGDNADYSAILKPYHGVYIYLNRGNFNYEQAYFYPINGTTKAVANDFDLDGDLDIAVISFFANLKDNPGESFIYFEQDENLTFIPHAVPVYEFGRWISMDVGDFEGDGDPDIVLGNYSRKFLSMTAIGGHWDMKLPFVLLENKTK